MQGWKVVYVLSMIVLTVVATANLLPVVYVLSMIMLTVVARANLLPVVKCPTFLALLLWIFCFVFCVCPCFFLVSFPFFPMDLRVGLRKDCHTKGRRVM